MLCFFFRPYTYMFPRRIVWTCDCVETGVDTLIVVIYSVFILRSDELSMKFAKLLHELQETCGGEFGPWLRYKNLKKLLNKCAEGGYT